MKGGVVIHMRKIITYIGFAGFILILLIPLVLLNPKKDAVSEIDNKYLAVNPFSAGGDFTDNCEAFISERIGFRNEEITLYTILNDKLFDEMVHPSYAYGKDGYVFFKFGKNKEYGDFEENFIHMLSEIQKYCEDRNVPFVFVFEPSKASIYTDKLPDGFNYNDDWVSLFTKRLDEEGINYVDNTFVLKSLRNEGIEGFNIKYNAGHWNDVGAFYGMNAILRNLESQGVNLHVNLENEYNVDLVLRDSLLVSQFPIVEYEPVYSLIDEGNIIKDISDQYDNEVVRCAQYHGFGYRINNKRQEEKCAKALVFQGSYINGMGYKFLENGFGEYIYVHDYQNILDFEYYFNIFKPDCVILDAAQYTFSSGYFDNAKMQAFELNPLLSIFDGYRMESISNPPIEIEQGETITNITINVPLDNIDYAYYYTETGEYDVIQKYDSANNTSYYSLSIENNNVSSDGVFYFIDTVNKVKYILNMN